MFLSGIRTIRGLPPITPKYKNLKTKHERINTNRGEKRPSVQGGKEFPLVNPFLFAGAITFLPLLNVSIDYEGACPL